MDYHSAKRGSAPRLVWQMSSCRRDRPQKKAISFQIVSPADGTSLPVYPEDFGIFPPAALL
jgi:hypothetical protein